jgi:hypothetical protein
MRRAEQPEPEERARRAPLDEHEAVSMHHDGGGEGQQRTRCRPADLRRLYDGEDEQQQRSQGASTRAHDRSRASCALTQRKIPLQIVMSLLGRTRASVPRESKLETASLARFTSGEATR